MSFIKCILYMLQLVYPLLNSGYLLWNAKYVPSFSSAFVIFNFGVALDLNGQH